MLVNKTTTSNIKKELEAYAKTLSGKIVSKDIYKYLSELHDCFYPGNRFKSDALYIELSPDEADSLVYDHLRYYSNSHNIYLVIYVGSNVTVDTISKLKQYKWFSEDMHILPNSHINKSKVSIFVASYTEKFDILYDVDFALHI